MAPISDDVYVVLKSIDATLKALASHLGAFQSVAAVQSTSQPDVADIASDADLDGKYGNGPIRAKDPRDWTGESQLGKPLSECPPAYLDLLAARYDYFATSNEDPKKQRYARIDAARCRGWAKRLRSGWKAPIMDASLAPELTADDIAF